jgi:tetratricopeptide (TPR) repeat protein
VDPGDVGVAYRHALLCLRAGDREGYRRACDRFLESVGPAPGAATANTVAWTCVLAPGASDAARIVSLAERAVATDPKSHAFLNTLAAALYRAGRFEEALGKLDAAVQAHGRGGDPEDCLFLAMAHHRLGRAAEARHWLAEAVRGLDRAAQSPPPEATLPWTQRLAGELLRREAEGLLRGTEADR